MEGSGACYHLHTADQNLFKFFVEIDVLVTEMDNLGLVSQALYGSDALSDYISANVLLITELGES